ncbi:MAG TPA: hypothetical protein VFL93_15360 [Longimicrobiaceae bacterium]|nr:hypothetical protein [Longimicrobiaceae bacterium]
MGTSTPSTGALHRSASSGPADGSPRRLSAAAREALERALGPTGTALAFAEAVVLQRAHPLGAAPVAGAEAGAVTEVLALLRACEDGTRARERAAELCREADLLSVLFQNVDLLYEAGHPHADAMGALVMAALERASP